MARDISVEITCFCPYCEKECEVRGIMRTQVDQYGRALNVCRHHPKHIRQHGFYFAERFAVGYGPGKKVVMPHGSTAV